MALRYCVRYLNNKTVRMLSSSLNIEATLLRKDMALLQKEKDLIKKENELELIKKDNELIKKDNELIKKDKELELTKANMELLKVQIKEQNWELLRTHEQLYLKEFMVLFREKYIRSQPGKTWPDKLTNFLRNKKESLDDWYFDEKLFVEKLSKLYEDFNNNAHPSFYLRGCIEIPVNMFTTIELKVLGFLWDNWPLPLRKFKIRYPQKGPVSIATFKRQKNEFEIEINFENV